MGRTFTQLRLTTEICLGLREAVRPFGDAKADTRLVIDFCSRLYLAHYSLESDPDLEAVDFSISQDEVMLINNFVSVEDGDWAKDLLHQTRQVLYELVTGREAVRLASSEDAYGLFKDVTLDPDKKDEPNPPEEENPAGEVKV